MIEIDIKRVAAVSKRHTANGSSLLLEECGPRSPGQYCLLMLHKEEDGHGGQSSPGGSRRLVFSFWLALL